MKKIRRTEQYDVLRSNEQAGDAAAAAATVPARFSARIRGCDRFPYSTRVGVAWSDVTKAEGGRKSDGRETLAASPDVTCRVVNSSFINYVARPSQVVRHHCSVDCANFSPLTCRNSVCGVADRCARCHCGFVSCQVTPLFCCLLTRDGNSYAS